MTLSTLSKPAPIDRLLASLEQWDRAADALRRRDYAEYDRITGFTQDNERIERHGRG